jgi:hypothetical protein
MKNEKLTGDEYDALEHIRRGARTDKVNACVGRNAKRLSGLKLVQYAKNGGLSLTDKGQEVLFLRAVSKRCARWRRIPRARWIRMWCSFEGASRTSPHAKAAATNLPNAAANRWPTSARRSRAARRNAESVGAAAVRIDQGAHRDFGRHVHRRQEFGRALQAQAGDRRHRLVDQVAGTHIGAKLAVHSTHGWRSLRPSRSSYHPSFII